MDSMTRQIAAYACEPTPDIFPDAIVSGARRVLLDSMGCALGGIGSEPVAIARKLVLGGAPSAYPGRVLGSNARASGESAAFINSAMIRYLDFNDIHHGSHPSEMIGALLALAEASGADGARLLDSIIVAYEVGLRLVRATEMRERGWDQGFAIGIGAAAGIGNLLGLPFDRIAHAVAITAVSNIPMRATRAGNLSLWKGAATAFSCRNAVFATLLAAEGMTGPDKPLEGRHGLWEQVTGPFELAPFPTEGGDYLLPATMLKYWPVEGNLLTAVQAALELREKIALEDIVAIDIDTYWSAWHETASEEEKWTPTNRETADHSMPYVFARAFTDGAITVASFDTDKVADPALRPLMQMIKVHHSDEVEAIYKATYPFTYFLRVTATGRDGGKSVIEVRNHRGTSQNPMNDEEVKEKFRILAEPVLGADRAAAAAQTWGAIDENDLSTALDMLEPPE
jgi:2-methylcitrate dehydratase